MNMNTSDMLKFAFMRGVVKASAEAGIPLQNPMTAFEKDAAWWTMPLLGAVGGGTLGALYGGHDPRNILWGALGGGLAGGALKGALAWRRASIARQAAKKALEQAGKEVVPKMGLGALGLVGGGLGAGYLLNQYLSSNQQQPQGMPMGPGMAPPGMPMDPNMQQSYAGAPMNFGMQQSYAGAPSGSGMSYPGGY